MSEKVIIEVGVTGTGEGEQKVKSLKAQLREMKNELLGLDEGSDRFKKLSKEAGELTDKIGDVSDKVKALSSDTKKLDALVGVGSAIAGGFQAAQGAMALFGSNSKEVEKAIQNIIAVQGILNGVQQVGQFLTTKGIVQDALFAKGKDVVSARTIAATAVQWLWNAALTANPIGLIVTAVALLVTGIGYLITHMKEALVYFQLFFGIGGEIENQEADNAKKREQRNKAASQEHVKRLSEIKAEKEAKITASNEQIKALELERATLEANGESSAAITVQILEEKLKIQQATLEGNQKNLQSWIDYYKNLALISGQSEADYIASMKRQGVDLLALQEKATNQINQNAIDVKYAELEITKFKREQNDAAIADSKETAAELAAIRQAEYEAELERLHKLQEQKIDLQQQIEDAENAYFDSKLSKEQQEINAVKDKYFSLITQAEQFGIDTAILLEAQLMEEAAIKQRYEDEEAERIRTKRAKDKAEFDEWKEKELQKERETRDKKAGIALEFAQASMNLVNTVFTLTNRLGKQDEASKEERAKRQFKIGKALQLGLAVMDGFKAITSSLAQAPIAIGPSPNPAGIASLAFAATTAALNISKIASTQYNGGASNVGVTTPNLGSASDSVGSTTPNVTPIQAGSTFLNDEPNKVYVLEKDITGTQNKVGAIVKEATF